MRNVRTEGRLKKVKRCLVRQLDFDDDARLYEIVS